MLDRGRADDFPAFLDEAVERGGDVRQGFLRDPTREWEKAQETSTWISLTPPDVSFPLTGPASHPHTVTVVNLSCEYNHMLSTMSPWVLGMTPSW